MPALAQAQSDLDCKGSDLELDGYGLAVAWFQEVLPELLATCSCEYLLGEPLGIYSSTEPGIRKTARRRLAG